MGELVRLMQGAPLYELQVMKDGSTNRIYTGHVQEVTMGVEVYREEIQDTGIHNKLGRKIRWSQVLVGGQLVWTRTVLLTRVEELGAGCEAG